MKFETSELGQLVVAYRKKFEKHVPLQALKVLKAVDLLPLLIDALATNTPLAETGWGWDTPIEFSPYSPRGCCIIIDENSERATPTKLPSGEWLH
jgi:hypothetical protein